MRLSCVCIDMAEVIALFLFIFGGGGGGFGTACQMDVECVLEPCTSH